MRRKTLVDQAPPVSDAKAVLLIDHHQSQLLKHDALLKQGMGAAHRMNIAIGEAFQHHALVTGLILAGQHFEAQADLGHQGGEARIMLAREDFGWCHQGRLHLSFRRPRHRPRRNQSLARADIALQQAQHRRGSRHVRPDFGKSAGLRACRLIGQSGQ